MRRAAVIVVLLSFFSVLGSPQDHPVLFSKGEFNGRFWTTLNHLAKIAYVDRYRNGITLAHSFTKNEDHLEVFAMPDLPNEDVLKGVDKFFAEPEKLRFPITPALFIFSLKVAGTSQKDIDLQMDILRKQFP
jgi:hypothetical protein